MTSTFSALVVSRLMTIECPAFPGPECEMGRNSPCLDRRGVALLRNGLVAELGFEHRVEREDPLPPLVEWHVAAPDGPQPLARFVGDRKGQSALGDQFQALEAESGAVHRVLGVVAMRGNQFLTSASASATVTTTAAGPEQPLSLRLHVTAVARDDVATDKGLAEALEFVAFPVEKMTGAQSDMRIEGLPEAARRTNLRRE